MLFATLIVLSGISLCVGSYYWGTKHSNPISRKVYTVANFSTLIANTVVLSWFSTPFIALANFVISGFAGLTTYCVGAACGSYWSTVMEQVQNIRQRTRDDEVEHGAAWTRHILWYESICQSGTNLIPYAQSAWKSEAIASREGGTMPFIFQHLSEPQLFSFLEKAIAGRPGDVEKQIRLCPLLFPSLTAEQQVIEKLNTVVSVVSHPITDVTFFVTPVVLAIASGFVAYRLVKTDKNKEKMESKETQALGIMARAISLLTRLTALAGIVIAAPGAISAARDLLTVVSLFRLVDNSVSDALKGKKKKSKKEKVIKEEFPPPVVYHPGQGMLPASPPHPLDNKIYEHIITGCKNSHPIHEWLKRSTNKHDVDAAFDRINIVFVKSCMDSKIPVPSQHIYWYYKHKILKLWGVDTPPPSLSANELAQVERHFLSANKPVDINNNNVAPPVDLVADDGELEAGSEIDDLPQPLDMKEIAEKAEAVSDVIQVTGVEDDQLLSFTARFVACASECWTTIRGLPSKHPKATAAAVALVFGAAIGALIGYYELRKSTTAEFESKKKSRKVKFDLFEEVDHEVHPSHSITGDDTKVKEAFFESLLLKHQQTCENQKIDLEAKSPTTNKRVPTTVYRPIRGFSVQLPKPLGICHGMFIRPYEVILFSYNGKEYRRVPGIFHVQAQQKGGLNPINWTQFTKYTPKSHFFFSKLAGSDLKLESDGKRLRDKFGLYYRVDQDGKREYEDVAEAMRLWFTDPSDDAYIDSRKEVDDEWAYSDYYDRYTEDWDHFEGEEEEYYNSADEDEAEREYERSKRLEEEEAEDQWAKRFGESRKRKLPLTVSGDGIPTIDLRGYESLAKPDPSIKKTSIATTDNTNVTPPLEKKNLTVSQVISNVPAAAKLEEKPKRQRNRASKKKRNQQKAEEQMIYHNLESKVVEIKGISYAPVPLRDCRLESVFPENVPVDIKRIQEAVIPLYHSNGDFTASGVCIGNFLVTVAHAGTIDDHPCYMNNGKLIKLKLAIGEKDLTTDLVCYQKPPNVSSLDMISGDHYNAKALFFGYIQPNEKEQPRLVACQTALVPSWKGDPKFGTHFASTREGCSGSPMIVDGKVVGIHRLGDPNAGNQYIKLTPQVQRVVSGQVKL
jgi:hypothetical protein